MRKIKGREKWEKVDNPLVQLNQDAQRLMKKFENKLEARKNYTFWVAILLEILSCQMRFLASIYVSIFLEEDYRNTELDRNVLNFFIGECDTYNELLELCEGLKNFLKKKKREVYGNDLFKIDYSKLRMKTPPFSHASDEKDAEHFRQYRDHISGIIKNFMSETKLLQKQVEIKWNQKLYTDDLMEFQQNAEKVLRRKSRKGRIAKYRSGKCHLPLDNQQKIQIDPVVIPLKKKTRKKVKFASIFCFNPKETVEQCPVKYLELTGEGRFFHTKNEELFNDLYFKKGNIVEAPSFSSDFHLWEKDIDLQLYEGDIFDLHFLEGMKGVKSALVSVMYADTKLKTPLSRRLEILAGHEMVDKLETKGNLVRGKVYTTTAGKLDRFSYILHCPVYDLGQKEKDSSGKDKKVIEDTIKNIINRCDESDVEWLIVPAMGSFWAGQTRRKVAQKWCEEIRNLAEESHLKRIVFSFTNKETLETYRKSIYAQIDDKFSGYHLPISRMHSDMMAASSNLKRLYAIDDLVNYLYVFVTACSLRSIYEAARKAKASGLEYLISDELKVAISSFRERLGLNQQGNFEHTKSLTTGAWRGIASLCCEAAKDDDIWCFPLHEGRTDFPEMRNDYLSHQSGRSVMPDEYYKKPADKYSNALREIIKQHPFLKQETVRLIYVEDSNFLEQEGKYQLQYRDLQGGFDTPPRSKLERQENIFENTKLQKGRVYLVKFGKESIKFLSLHPFILFAGCNACHRRSVFWLKDIKQKGNKNQVEMDYASVECRCRQIEGSPIGKKTLDQLREDFENILNILGPSEHPPEPKSEE